MSPGNCGRAFGPVLFCAAVVAFAQAPAGPTISQYGSLPTVFEPNQGQTDPQVKFLSRGHGYRLFLTSREAVLTLAGPAANLTLRMKLMGANAAAELEGLDRQPGFSNYFIGSDPRRWRRHVPQYARVRCRQVWRGIDLVYYAHEGQLEYDFEVAPGADPRAIQLAFEGTERVRVDRTGDLVLTARGREVRLRKPVIYQAWEGRRSFVEGGYVLLGPRRVGFRVSQYDPSRALVIDPVFNFSTYLGGSGVDEAYAVAVDSAGQAHIAGRTWSADFPVTSGAARRNAPGGANIFVAKLNPTGTQLVYSTYVGGRYDDAGFGIALDAAGNAYLTGMTSSDDFPTTPGALITRATGAYFFVGFVVKLNPTGSELLYSTYLAGSQDRQDTEAGRGIAVDSSGNAYVTGHASSRDFPTTPGAFQRNYAGRTDAFVAKLNPAGSALVYSTLLGSPSFDSGVSIALDAAGNAFVAGYTRGADFPTTAGAFQRTHRGGAYDVFLAKLNPAGSSLVYSTLLGGSGWDEPRSVAVDAAGSAYVTGHTTSDNFPTTAGAWQPKRAGGPDAFALKLNLKGSALGYSTYLGGSLRDEGYGIALDAAGNAHVAGFTESDDFPQANALQPARGGGRDAFIAKLSPSGVPVYSSFLGGRQSDAAYAVAVDSAGAAYLTGQTCSGNFPTTPGALRAGYAGNCDAFAAKVTDDASAGLLVKILSAASFSGTTLAPESLASAFGDKLATSTATAEPGALPTSLAGTTVTVEDSSGVRRDAQLSYASPQQVNFVVPAGLASGPAKFTVTSGDGTVSRAQVRIAPAAPGLFSANANGQGVAAALLVTAPADGAQLTSPIFRYDAARRQNVAVPLDLRAENAQYVLTLFGTGIRGRAALADVLVKIGGAECDVLYAGAQGEYPGLDQVNVRLPRSLLGRDELSINLSVGGASANVVTVSIGGRPRIVSLSPDTSQAGQTLDVMIEGEYLRDVTALEFTPAAGISVSDLLVTENVISARVAVAADAASGVRRVVAVSPSSNSRWAQFAVLPKPGGTAPFIYRVRFGQAPTGPDSQQALLAGGFEFIDSDGDIRQGDTRATSARLTFTLGGCILEAGGGFLHRPGQTTGKVEFAFQHNFRQAFTSTTSGVVVQLIDAAGNRSNAVEVEQNVLFCGL